jgi:hypothetical protein
MKTTKEKINNINERGILVGVESLQTLSLEIK